MERSEEKKKVIGWIKYEDRVQGKKCSLFFPHILGFIKKKKKIYVPMYFVNFWKKLLWIQEWVLLTPDDALESNEEQLEGPIC